MPGVCIYSLRWPMHYATVALPHGAEMEIMMNNEDMRKVFDLAAYELEIIGRGSAAKPIRDFMDAATVDTYLRIADVFMRKFYQLKDESYGD